MITDERDLAQSLRTVDTPPGLTLDPEQVVGRARRSHRRSRTGRGAVAAGSVAAVTATALWATGTTLGPLEALPAAPWVAACQGITTGPDGTEVDLDHISYAEVPVALWPSAPEGTPVVGLDTCGDGTSRVAFALRGPEGRLTHIEAPFRPGSDELEGLQSGALLRPGLATLGSQDVVHFGVVGQDVTDLRFLTRGGSPSMAREPLPGTGLDGYIAHSGTGPEQTLGVTWTDAAGQEHLQWLNVLEVVTFGGAGGGNEPLVAQDRDGVWHLWLPDATEEHGHTRVEGVGGSISAEAEDGSYEHLALLRDGVDLEAETPPDGPGPVVRYAESADGEARFAWAKVPPGGTLYEVDADGHRINTLGQPPVP